METKINKIKTLFISIRGWITIHFGRNPKNGGNPPNDSMFIIINILVSVDSVLAEKIWLKWNNLYEWNNNIMLAEIVA